MENKLEKFERLATKRTEEACKKIQLIGNLANKNSYEYSKEHLEIIFSAVDDAVKTMKERFNTSTKEDNKKISFEKLKK